MNIKTNILNKICAVLVLTAILVSDFLFVGTKLISYALDNVKTNIYNVDFLAYFLDENGEKVEKIEKPIDDENSYLYVDIDVKNEGYFNGVIDLENNNFELIEKIESLDIAKISKNQITLKQINAGQKITLKLPIKAKVENRIKFEYLSQKTKIVLNGKYANSKNSEKIYYTNVNGESEVEIDWKSSESTQAELNAKILTNYAYKIDDQEKQIVQILIGSKILNNNYPVKNTEINLNVLPNVENIEVHTRSTDATNENIKFGKSNYTYNKETNNLKINLANDNLNEVSWNNNCIDLFVVTYVLPKDENITNKEILIENKIDTYDEKHFTAKKTIGLDEKIDGIISYSINNSEKKIYKGKIYIGESREYKETQKINIDYIGIAEKISLSSKKDVYLSDIEEKNANILYKQTKINKEEFIKLFGEDGFITIKDNSGIVIANINNNTIPDEQGNLVVNYLDNIRNIEIITSKPIHVGILNIENSKIILNNEYKREDVNSFISIKSSFIGSYNEKKNETKENQIELDETTTKAKFAIEQKKLTADTTNENVKMKVVLQNNNEDLDIFSNPEIKIKLPKQITNITAKCKVLYGNGLTLGETSLANEDDSQIITIKLNGEQKAYNSQNIEGTVIAIYANIDVDKNALTSTEEIVLNYTNEFATSIENDGEQKVKVKIIEAKKEETVVKQEPKVKQENETKLESDNNQESQNKTSNQNSNNQTKRENKVVAQETKELNGIRITASATVGGDDLSVGEEIKAGEIVVYNIKLENTNDVDVEGLTLNANIPDDTTLIQVNPEYPDYDEEHENYTTDKPFFITKDNKEIIKDNISISKGTSVEYNYMIKVKSDVTETKQINTSITLKEANNNSETVTINNIITSGTLEATVQPLYRDPKTNLSVGYTYMYVMYIQNNSNEEQKNVQVTLNKNELVDFVQIEYYTVNAMVTTKKTSFTIDSIPAKNTVGVVIYTKAKEFTKNDNLAKLSFSIADSKNNIYRTNMITDKVDGVLANISLISNTTSSSETKYLKEGDELNYQIKVKNTGTKKAEKLSIKDKFSKYLELESVTLNNEKCEYILQTGNREGNIEYSNIIIKKELDADEEVTINIKGKVSSYYTEKNLEILNQASVFNEIKLAETEKDFYYLEANNKQDETNNNGEDNKEEENNNDSEPKDDNENNNTNNDDESNEDENNPQDETNNENEQNNENNSNNINNENNSENNQSEEKKNLNYISGLAWLDKNKNGRRDSQEELLSDIEVTLLNLDSNLTQNTSTDKDGTYSFQDIEDGKYVVIFEYDDETYSLTTYQADGVNTSQNSDVEMVELNRDGENVTVAATDTLTINNSRLTNIDIGLTEATTFDLSLTKSVSKVTVSNSQGTTVQEFKDNNLAKVEIKAKYLKGTTVVIEYVIKVTNNGEIAGYVPSIVDYKPVDLNFNSKLNSDWYQEENELYNNSLEETLIKPGETKELKLILTKQMTETNTGLTNNIAEIAEAENDMEIDDINSTPGNKNAKENDQGQANVIISVSTGAAVRFAFITLFTTIIIATAGYVISKKILEKNIKF